MERELIWCPSFEATIVDTILLKIQLIKKLREDVIDEFSFEAVQIRFLENEIKEILHLNDLPLGIIDSQYELDELLSSMKPTVEKAMSIAEIVPNITDEVSTSLDENWWMRDFTRDIPWGKVSKTFTYTMPSNKSSQYEKKLKDSQVLSIMSRVIWCFKVNDFMSEFEDLYIDVTDLKIVSNFILSREEIKDVYLWSVLELYTSKKDILSSDLDTFIRVVSLKSDSLAEDIIKKLPK